MFKNFRKKYISSDLESPVDKNLLWAFVLLIILGLYFLASASAVSSFQLVGHSYHYLKEQIVPLIVGAILCFVFYKIDYRYFKRVAFLALIVSIVLLILVFIPALSLETYSSRSWINIFGRSFQPSELVKLTFLVYLATWLESKKGELKKIESGTIPFIVVVSIISLLIMLQPDFGTLVIILTTAVVTFFVGGGNYKHLGVVFLLLVILASSFLYSRFSSSEGTGYQEKRIACYLDPSHDRQGSCYQINQALISIGSGGLWGRGIGQSRQKFLFIPKIHNDAIFPIIAEEIGFIFTLLLVSLYLYIFYRGYLIAKEAPDIYGRSLAFGIVAWLSIQTFFNIGGMSNLIPMTGTTLPFISHGGSSLISAMAAMGILLNISRYKVEKPKYAKR